MEENLQPILWGEKKKQKEKIPAGKALNHLL